MKRTKNIAIKYLPPRLPIWPTIIIWLLMDRLQASQLAWGIVGTIFVLVWFASIVNVVLYVPTHPSDLPRIDEA